MLKKIIAIFCFACVFFFSALQTNFAFNEMQMSTAFAKDSQVDEKHNQIHIIATSFHEFDWIRQIIGVNNERFTLTLLIDNGVDMHSFEPTMRDINRITHADVFIHNGGPSDTWVKDILAHSVQKENKNTLKIFNVMQELGDVVREEAIVEGMQEGIHHHEHAHEHAHEHNHDADHEHDEHGNCIIPDAHTQEYTKQTSHADHEHDEHGNCIHKHHEHAHHEHASHADEHVWLSLHNAMLICEKLSQLLTEIDPMNKDVYVQNVEKYKESLKALDEKFRSQRAMSPRDTVIVADRFPFLYMLEDYDIEYYAAFHGCSAETEASFKTIAFLTDKVNELDIKTLLILEHGMKNLAETIAKNSNNCAIRELSSMQSITKEDIAKGVTYYSIMEDNFEILYTVLSE